ncbi:MAG: glutamine synthetase family protein [Candidatus Thorarchaeota archaeon]|nr:glutamine synthetase family protein [Candidatus Thorarchaeota archaeon]
MSEKIEYIELRFTDLLGRMKAMVVPCKPVDDLEDLQSDPTWKKGTSCDGSSVVGLATVEASDLRLDPDASTLIEIPLTSQRTAAAMCFIREKEAHGTSTDYHTLDSRGRLHQVCEDLLPGNLRLMVKVEPEFHFITPEGEHFDNAGYADTYPQSPGMDILLELASAIREVGMRPRVIHHEAGEAQQEIELDFDDARKMADNILIFKNLTRAIAQSHGVDVTFMPKPFVNEAGSGLHCHMQLWDGNKNLFGDDKTDGLSETARRFIAGLLEHAPAITAIANPTVNSYKRLVPHHEAPVYITWGEKNRTVLVRIPTFGKSEKAAIELRSGDSMANPYLFFSAIIAAGMDGINKKLVPPEPRSEDIFMMTDDDRSEYAIRTLPTTLEEALDSLEADPVIMKALGSGIAHAHIKLKRAEWRKYVSHVVSDWEWEMYQDL